MLGDDDLTPQLHTFQTEMDTFYREEPNERKTKFCF